MNRCRILRVNAVLSQHCNNLILQKPRLPNARACLVQYRSISTDEKPYYVTTPIFYPNSVPHIGHLHSLVTADILARFHRLTHPHQTVHFLTGTDEHGLKIQRAARDQGLGEKEFCDTISERFRELAKKANIGHTQFIRTTEQAHHDAVTHLWSQLDKKGLIYKDAYTGWYSISDECFYTDSQIRRITDPITLTKSFISIETSSPVTYCSEETYKFRLSAFREELLKHFLANPASIQPKPYYDQVVRQLSNEDGTGLEDLSISRPKSRMEWGVGVPGDSEHTIYVWIDALTVYLTGTGYPWKYVGDGEKGGWPADLQIIGKDILRFHALYFPAMLLALNLPLPKTLLTHAHWTTNQKKMSKSLGNVADPIEAMDTFGVDGVRYYMARIGGRFKDDADWSTAQAEKHLDEIRSLLGNFFLRITSRAILSKISTISDSVPSLSEILSPTYMEGDILHDHNRKVLASLKTLGSEIESNLESLEVAEALDKVVLQLKQANAAMTAIKPWASDPIITHCSYLTSLETLRITGICLQPFMPTTACRLLDALGVGMEERTWIFTQLGKGRVADVKGIVLFEPKEKGKPSNTSI